MGRLTGLALIDQTADGNIYAFYNTLIDGLLGTLDTVKAFANRQRGTALVSAEYSLPPVVTKYEYILYVQLYGPPVGGQFNELTLQRIRDEYGAQYEAYQYIM